MCCWHRLCLCWVTAFIGVPLQIDSSCERFQQVLQVCLKFSSFQQCFSGGIESLALLHASNEAQKAGFLTPGTGDPFKVTSHPFLQRNRSSLQWSHWLCLSQSHFMYNDIKLINTAKLTARYLLNLPKKVYWIEITDCPFKKQIICVRWRNFSSPPCFWLWRRVPVGENTWSHCSLGPGEARVLLPKQTKDLKF